MGAQENAWDRFGGAVTNHDVQEEEFVGDYVVLRDRRM
jgi:hypothetical protein